MSNTGAMSVRPELSSMSSALDDLATRVGAMADDLADEQREQLTAALFEVERSLRNAQRRLSKLVDDLA